MSWLILFLMIKNPKTERMPISKRIKVTYKRLTKVNGWSYGNGSVEIDSRLKGKKLLEILIHECMHEVFPELEEDEIEKKNL